MSERNLKVNRILASLIDGFFMFIITAAVCIAPLIVFLKEYFDGKFITSDFLWLLFSIFGSFALWILYLWIPTLIFKNATIGMKFTHLVFINSRENPSKFSSFLFREFMVVVCIVGSFGLSLVADLICLTMTEKGKTFYDVASSLRVVSTDYAD